MKLPPINQRSDSGATYKLPNDNDMLMDTAELASHQNVILISSRPKLRKYGRRRQLHQEMH